MTFFDPHEDKTLRLPALSNLPNRRTSFELDAYLSARSPAAEVMEELMARVRAEYERMRRTLPEPPHGMEWRGEIQSRERIDASFTADDVVYRFVYRLVYRLVAI